MKRNPYFLSILVILFALLSFVSCKKDDDEQSRREMLLGTWHLDFEAYDDNSNGRLDASEREASSGLTLQFNSNGTGTITESGISDSFTWELENDNTLEIDGQPLRIHTLTNNILVLEAEDLGDLYWLGFER
ncbi:MAG: lipocalin family protein [Chitinophagaceae bacterium]